MKKILLVCLLITTPAYAIEKVDSFGNRISNRCNAWNGHWTEYPNVWQLIGSSCHLLDGTQGIAYG